MGLVFALLYLGLWYLISFGFGSSFEFDSFPSLTGFEKYTLVAGLSRVRARLVRVEKRRYFNRGRA